MTTWAFFSIYQSLVFYYFVTASSSSSQSSSGKVFGLWDISTMTFTCIVVTVNLRLLMICNSITRWHYITVGGSILAWFLFIFLYSGIMTPHDRQVSFFAFFFFPFKKIMLIHLFSLLIFILLLPLFSAGKCIFRHICLNEYIILLRSCYPCPRCCTSL